MKADKPSDAAYGHVAWLLGVDKAAIEAVAQVEAGPEGAFLPSDEPVILYERHVFSRLTAGRWDRDHPDLSNPIRGGYGKYSEQHARLSRAAELNRNAALESASWGLFQIMGENFRQAGYQYLQDFINAQYGSVDDHLRCFALFIWNDPRLLLALREHKWERFAYLYNGPKFAESHYDKRMADSWARLTYRG